MSPPLILASSSPRRRDLLTQHGYTFSILTAEVEELTPPHLTVRETVLLNARLKGQAVAALHRTACVIAADTLVSFEGRPLGKPASLNDAREMLATLSGRTHQVFSGVYIEHRAAATIAAFTDTSHVTFRKISAPEIEDYIQKVHILDKAGAYAAQDDPIHLIAAIHGSRTNVIGLPMERLELALAPILARPVS